MPTNIPSRHLSRVINSKGRGKCSLCGKWFDTGTAIYYANELKGADGYLFKWHAEHPGGGNWYQTLALFSQQVQIADGIYYLPDSAKSPIQVSDRTPPAASSEGQAGAGGKTVQPLSGPSGPEPFVFYGAWVPLSKLDVMSKALKEARQ